MADAKEPRVMDDEGEEGEDEDEEWNKFTLEADEGRVRGWRCGLFRKGNRGAVRSIIIGDMVEPFDTLAIDASLRVNQRPFALASVLDEEAVVLELVLEAEPVTGKVKVEAFSSPKSPSPEVQVEAEVAVSILWLIDPLESGQGATCTHENWVEGKRKSETK